MDDYDSVVGIHDNFEVDVKKNVSHEDDWGDVLVCVLVRIKNYDTVYVPVSRVVEAGNEVVIDGVGNVNVLDKGGLLVEDVVLSFVISDDVLAFEADIYCKS